MMKLEDYFLMTGFYDLLPLAKQMAKKLGFNQNEIIEAVCKTSDKFYQYPPTRNRAAWFSTVFKEKLYEARADILAFDAKKDY